MDTDPRFGTCCAPCLVKSALCGFYRAWIGFEYQNVRSVLCKGFQVRMQLLGRRFAVLPFEDAVENEIVRIGDEAWRGRPGSAPRNQHMRKFKDRFCEPGLEYRSVEIARQPDFERMIQRVAPLRRHCVGFPNGHPDGIVHPKCFLRPNRRDAMEEVKILLNRSSDQ